jgi:LuxR family transcriptional regulator, maltose regulon positive regulatory protein
MLRAPGAEGRHHGVTMTSALALYRDDTQPVSTPVKRPANPSGNRSVKPHSGATLAVVPTRRGCGMPHWAPSSIRPRALQSFARTKIQQPRAQPGALLPRPALQQRLVDALLHDPLVLISAAAGYGKTSALTQALDALPAGTAVAWVGCDAGDAPLQLFSCLVAALEPFDLPWRTAPEALIAASLNDRSDDDAARARGLRTLSSELINALDAADVTHGVIAVDDLHRVDHPVVFQFLGQLLERFTPRWTLVLVTRHDPPMALQRLRAQGGVAQFQAADLQFDAAQVQAVATAQGVDASDAEALFERTHGWPAGLQLALRVVRAAPGSTLSGRASQIDRQVFDFLATEVLDRLPNALRDFLLATAVLPELTAGRCAALSGDRHAAEHLEAIERAGLFVTTLDASETTLRLHDLFRDALEHRLQRLPGDRWRLQLQKAAASEPDPARRLAYWLRAACWSEAARELHLQSYALLTAGQSGTVQRWLERFPASQAGTLPDLQLVRTLLAWMHWRWTAMADAAQAAAIGFEREGRSLEATAARAYEVLALRGGGLRADSDQLLQRVTIEVDTLLAARGAEWRAGLRRDGNDPGMLAAMLGREAQVWCAFDEAHFDDAARLTQSSLGLLDHSTGLAPLFQMLPLPGYVGLRHMQPVLQHYVRVAGARLQADDAHMHTLTRAIDGSVRVWSGAVREGLALLRESGDEVRWHDFPLRSSLHVYPFLCLADLLLGDLDALRADADALQRTLMRASENAEIGRRVASELFQLGRWLHAAGLVDDALRVWRTIRHWHDPQTRPVWVLQRSAADAWIALAEGEFDTAERGFSEVLDAHGDKLDIFGQATELRLRCAGLRLALGRSAADAAEVLRPVFARHANDADIASVWQLGPDGLRALALARWQGVLDTGERATLLRWADEAAALRGQVGAASTEPALPEGPARPVQSPSRLDPSALPAELSQREWEVLGRLASGESNKVIARTFDLSPHTVKRHVANILLKLDLRSRGQASAWYHARAAASPPSP